ncbi:leucyl aminopeptidase [Helicobacter sp. MIT 05-5294]|uniref:leucyl aminopeptidase n=1 Tax=Helicobacter sp. MIT 05-5294 TaxID=1548150 RepID=UPI00051FCB1A|nr:leucyl aminopeptidase [Helicobacter sp. MIT 05-5294]TLD88562.1 leucyl aminopeptidase [Helicobacter sp. MIT 05-5294]
MEILANSKKRGDLEIVLLYDKKLPKNLTKAEKEALEIRNYKGEGSCFVESSRKFFVGVESHNYPFPNALRDALASAVGVIGKLKVKSASLQVKTKQEAREVCEGIMLGAYCFDTFKTKKNENNLKEVYLHTTQFAQTDLESIIKDSKILSESVNAIRELINTPPMIATPKYVADFAQRIAKDSGLECKVYDEKFLKSEKMGAFLAVAKASANKPYLVHLSYKPKGAKGKKLPKVVLVGKGLTYDSGGLSLKPGEFMTTMKSDKSGACAVLGILESVAKLGLKAEVHGILGLAENMIGGDAYKPDDILIARNQKSIEVRNTDAEGRLVLADCLSFASDLNPDVLIDLATLTGACVVALGDYSTGIMGYNQKLKEDFAKAAFEAGELSGILPFNPYLRKLFNSEVADLCNIPSSRYGSAISAGMFLGEFVKESLVQKWLHLDIAGPAYVEKAWGVNPFGASGAGIRAVVQFITNLAK